MVWRHANKAAVREAKQLVRAKKASSSMWYRYDVLRNPVRVLYLLEHGRRFYKKYKTYCPEQN